MMTRNVFDASRSQTHSRAIFNCVSYLMQKPQWRNCVFLTSAERRPGFAPICKGNAAGDIGFPGFWCKVKNL